MQYKLLLQIIYNGILLIVTIINNAITDIYHNK
jgi:hypothetical protein